MDNRQLRTMIPEMRETNEVSPTIITAYYLERLSRWQYRKGDPQTETGGHAQLRRQFES